MNSGMELQLQNGYLTISAAKALDEEGKGKGEGSPDIAEVEEIEEVFLREPERDAHCLEDSK